MPDARYGGLKSAAAVVLGAALLVAVGASTGHLHVFYDTMDYVRQGAWLAGYLHMGGQISDSIPDPFSIAAPVSPQVEYYVMSLGSRSPAYGLFLYMACKVGTLWLAVCLQSLIAAWPCFILAKIMVPASRFIAYAILLVVVSFGSALPFFVDFSMPDVFSGIVIVVAAVLLVAPSDRLGIGEKIGLWLLLFLAAASHTSNVATLLLEIGFAAVLLAASGCQIAPLAKRVAIVGMAFAAALLCNGLVRAAYKADTGLAQGTIPFLTARALTDGYGREYLEAACPGGASPALCAFKGRPMTDEQSILWDGRRMTGIFSVATLEVKRQIEADDVRFALASAAYDPILALTAAARNWGRQLVDFQVDMAFSDPCKHVSKLEQSNLPIKFLLPNLEKCADFEHVHRQRVSSYRMELAGLIPPDYVPDPPSSMQVALGRWHIAVTIICLAITIGAFVFAYRVGVFRRKPVTEPQRSVLATTFAIAAVSLSGLLLNAAVCGILSGTNARYQARVEWILPFMAVACVLALRTASNLRAPSEGRLAGETRQTQNQPSPAGGSVFVRFCIVGGVGFLIDLLILSALVTVAHVAPIGARLVSFPVALAATFALNRQWAFRHAERSRLLSDFWRYVTVQGLGVAVNLIVYAAVCAFLPTPLNNPAIALVLASGTALLINFLGISRFVFRDTTAVFDAPAPLDVQQIIFPAVAEEPNSYRDDAPGHHLSGSPRPS